MSGFCPTSTWELLIAFPRTQSLRVEARESGRREAGSAVLIDLEIRPGSLNAYRVGLWQSLVATGSVNSASELARMGLPRAEICSIVEFRPAATPEEFAAVLAMRTKAYRRAHKYTGEGPMTDRFDPRAIIICAFIGPRPIASLRLMAHGEGEEWEHDRFIQWPADFPARAQCVEASRMCVDPDFQRVAEALFTGILRRAVVVVLALKRRYVLGCATDALLPLYRKTGCVVIPVRFTHTDLGPKAHTLILADINSRVRGNGLAFTTWLLKWSDTARWVSRIGLIKSRGPIQKVGASVAAGVAALLAPFARRILRNVG
ncbi:MAG: hypothetical protein E6Q76_05725 [Rhizobium sp.]|nr:MAG: hypothetical protein E6Q76_05725 [Rhizobium sp.]